MKIVLRIFIAFSILLLALVSSAYLLPRHYRVERTTTIAAAPAVVFQKVSDLREWKNWGVWFERDAQMKLTYSPDPASVGGWHAWESQIVGNGKATITALTPTANVTYALEFPDMGTRSNGSFVLVPTPDGVKVTWADEGDLGVNPAFRWFGFLLLEKLIGKDFEAGLAKLKSLSETRK